jgi:23S rRNA pseudouridine1911/1915/1917 synthase
MPLPQTFHVEADQQGNRLDQFLEIHLDDVSRTYAQKLIRAGEVTVNGSPSKPGYKLRAGDCVSVSLPELVPLETVQPEPIPLDILYEDESLLVINKPAGMLVHPASGVNSGTLVNALLAHCKELPGVGGVQRPGIVHRLDKDTSGLLVAAKTDHAHHRLSAQFEAHTAARRYYAVVCGVPARETGTIEAQLTRSRRDRRKMTTTEEGGRRAVTHYRIAEAYGRFALLELMLETGRIHQIRVHLSYIGHPVAGDPVYGGGAQQALLEAQRALLEVHPELKAALAKLNRQALHAHTLSFDHPETNERMTFSAPMPADMQRLVDALRKLAQ